MAGPSTPPTTGPAPDQQHINDGDIKDIATDDPYKAHPITIDGSADILIIVLAAGYGEAHDQDFGMEKTLTNTAPLALCQKSGGCKCPDGTAGASEFTTPSQGLVSLGLDGGDTGIASYAAGLSLDKYCKQPDPPGPPPAAPAAWSAAVVEAVVAIYPNPPPPPGISQGDPHLLTFDNRPYDLQSAGEFTLAKSTVDDFLVQVRQVPLPGPYPVAVNSAVAAKLGGHRVTLQLENSVLVARVDGVPDNTGGVMNVGTGTLERLGTDAGVGFLLEWPDGTTVEVGRTGYGRPQRHIQPSAARAGTLTGLLGNDNGQPGDDLTTSGRGHAQRRRARRRCTSSSRIRGESRRRNHSSTTSPVNRPRRSRTRRSRPPTSTAATSQAPPRRPQSVRPTASRINISSPIALSM